MWTYCNFDIISMILLCNYRLNRGMGETRDNVTGCEYHEQVSIWADTRGRCRDDNIEQKAIRQNGDYGGYSEEYWVKWIIEDPGVQWATHSWKSHEYDGNQAWKYQGIGEGIEMRGNGQDLTHNRTQANVTWLKKRIRNSSHRIVNTNDIQSSHFAFKSTIPLWIR